ncbi:invasion associated locus B family protein [Jannaschia sp. CCS1]|uniref:invasion associated locus B family protein n=1 Tax=Jannaschia sp. (strain CCS1) TaxID=290400 RepID=UPI000053C2A9|nr:invasion associated locus B family protein [Jannaschia sp. CCS1]ABD54943.1 invasion associated locus B [Jannaschia sp. CCS1]
MPCLLALVLCHIAPAAAQSPDQSTVFGDWERVCSTDGACVFSQANADADTNDIRMRTEISRVSDTQILMSVVVPDSVLLTEGPWLTIDGIYVGELNYVQCPGGCLARILFTDQQFRLVSGGTRGVITVTAGGQRVGLVVSMDGLQDGLASLDDL